MGKQVTDYLLYRWRYILGYSLIGLAVIGLVIIAGLMVPGGLSQMEMKSVVDSDSISLSLNVFNPDAIVNLPYHILQRASIELFGLSTVSIKLPSLILGLLSALGMLLLLRTWFRQNVAIITTILVITTGQFLFVAQSGTPSIVYIFWTVWLLLSAMMVSRKARGSTFWKMMLFGIAALSLYTPLSLYIIVALLSAVILHPHLRYIVRRLSKPKLILAIFCGLVLIAPLIYTIIRFPSTGLTLLGVPDAWPDIKANLIQILKQYFDFVSPNSDILMTPIYSLGSMILIALGFLRLVTTKYTARSYIISIWIILLLPVLIINPSYVSITFIPVILLMAMGISQLLTRWYRLFPRNPYARLAGLVPLAVLISGMVVSGVDRYMYGYLYSPQTAVNFSDDLRIINDQLGVKDRAPVRLVVSGDEAPFYTAVAHHGKNISVVTAVTPATPSTLTIVSREAKQANTIADAPSEIITGSNTNNADRFYIYKTPTK